MIYEEEKSYRKKRSRLNGIVAPDSARLAQLINAPKATGHARGLSYKL